MTHRLTDDELYDALTVTVSWVALNCALGVLKEKQAELQKAGRKALDLGDQYLADFICVQLDGVTTSISSLQSSIDHKEAATS